ncbi:MAG: aldo/keto reductase [Lachnospiraceae bacterium]
MKLVLGTMTFGESVFQPDVDAFIRTFLEHGGEELDTAYVYNEGNCERLLGEVLPVFGCSYKIATKVNPRITGKLDGEAAYMQVNESLERLGLPAVDTVYLHFPDPATPVESVLEAMNNLHSQGKYRELGLSNFPAWMVADVWHICDKYGWVVPTVFEGIYNPLARKAEVELNDVLNHYGLRFYAYNPLAGGLLTGRYGKFEADPADGRFTYRPNYRNRYWKKSCFEAVDVIKMTAETYGITIVEATYRWLAYHSMLNTQRGDGILIGASKLSHLIQNMEALKAGSLPKALVEAFEKMWEIVKSDSPEYFTVYDGKGSVGGVKNKGGKEVSNVRSKESF